MLLRVGGSLVSSTLWVCPRREPDSRVVQGIHAGRVIRRWVQTVDSDCVDAEFREVGDVTVAGCDICQRIDLGRTTKTISRFSVTEVATNDKHNLTVRESLHWQRSGRCCCRLCPAVSRGVSEQRSDGFLELRRDIPAGRLTPVE